MIASEMGGKSWGCTAEVSVQLTLKHNVVRILNPARQPKCCAVCAVALPSRPPLSPQQPIPLLGPPVDTGAQLRERDAAVPPPHRIDVGWPAVAVGSQALGPHHPKVVVQLAGARLLGCCCYSVQVVLQGCPPHYCRLRHGSPLQAELHPCCLHGELPMGAVLLPAVSHLRTQLPAACSPLPPVLAGCPPVPPPCGATAVLHSPAS